jgi:hypothetical protein
MPYRSTNQAGAPDFVRRTLLAVFGRLPPYKTVVPLTTNNTQLTKLANGRAPTVVLVCTPPPSHIMTELKMKALKTASHDDHLAASDDEDDIVISTATRVKDGVNLLDALDRLGFVQRPSAGRRIGVGLTSATGLGRHHPPPSDAYPGMWNMLCGMLLWLVMSIYVATM